MRRLTTATKPLGIRRVRVTLWKATTYSTLLLHHEGTCHVVKSSKLGREVLLEEEAPGVSGVEELERQGQRLARSK